MRRLVNDCQIHELMPRPIVARVSRRAIAHNLAIVRSLAPRSAIWGVVKADAYGHGLMRTTSGASNAFANADGLALLDAGEAVALREAGWTRPILLLEGPFVFGDCELAARFGLTIVVHDDAQITMLERGRFDRTIDVYLKMNSGMNRLGFTPGRYAKAYRRLAHLHRVATITLMTHFANSDRDEGVAAEMECFERGARALTAPRSLANSAAILAHPATHADWVRPGIMLYGASPFATRSAAEFGLVAAMTLQSEIIATQTLAAGDVVGYGHRYTADRAMRIGVVACGYADGYPRVAPNGTPVLVGGVRTRLVGRVSMDMLTVELTPTPFADVGTPVELWGVALPVDEIAQAAGTVGYELLCALAPRVPVTLQD